MNSEFRTGPGPKGHYDLAVVGAGSAGFSAAITAAEAGARVALIGQGTLGGTCVNVGCVPSKALIRAAEAVHHANTASRFSGVEAAGRVADWNALRRQKDELVTALRQSKYVDLLPAYSGVTYLEGRARLDDRGVTVDGQRLRAEKTIIATGSHEFVPELPGLGSVPYLTSTTAFELEKLPQSLLIVGGGYIGCELAQMFARAGVKVTLLFRSRLLPQAEPEIGAALAGYLSQDGVVVQPVEKYESVHATGPGVDLAVTIDGEAAILQAQSLLLSAGRRANTEGLGLDEAGVALSANRGIEVDDRMRTTKSGTYAAGDVTGQDLFVYMAAYGAKIAASNALNGDGLVYDKIAMPAVVFTDPQVASVGLTEAAARKRGIDVRTSILALDNLPRAQAARDTRGLIKLVAEGSSKKLLGAHILAPEGADSIQTAALALRQGLTYSDLAEMIFPYLTTVEGLKLAAQTFETDVSKLSCCAG
ncbi:MAG: mercury(II) reductase [Kiloniellaceae bacterium]